MLLNDPHLNEYKKAVNEQELCTGILIDPSPAMKVQSVNNHLYTCV